MINPFSILYDLTEQFYGVMSSLFNWFSSDIELLGLTFAPFDIIFNWFTLSAIILAVLIKKVVPLT